VKTREPECPTCRSRFSQILPSPWHRTRINGFQVMCCYTSAGCTHKDALIRITEHEVNACAFRPIKCVDCGEFYFAQDTEDHSTKKCPLRRVPCQYCTQAVSVVELAWHEREQCHAVALKCPNGCRTEDGQEFACLRGHMDAHRASCPREPCNCSYSKYGCGRLIAREELAAHERDAVLHLRLLTSVCDEHTLKLELMSKMLDEIKQRVQAAETVQTSAALVRCEDCMFLD
jgi:hypothetical protein